MVETEKTQLHLQIFCKSARVLVNRIRHAALCSHPPGDPRGPWRKVAARVLSFTPEEQSHIDATQVLVVKRIKKVLRARSCGNLVPLVASDDEFDGADEEEEQEEMEWMNAAGVVEAPWFTPAVPVLGEEASV